MGSELKLAGGAATAAVLDAGLWIRLARRALAPWVLLQGLVAAVLLVVTVILAAVLPRWLMWLVPLGFAIWLWPPVLRWFVGEVATRATRGVAAQAALEPQELPAVAHWRAWWRPLMVGLLALAPIDEFGLTASVPVMLAFLGVLAWATAPALARSVLAPWFGQDDIDAQWRADRSGWAVLAAFWLIVFILLHWIVLQATGFGSLDLAAGAASAWSHGTLAAFVLARLAGLALITAAVGIFCTAGAARMAAQRMLDARPRPAPGDASADELPSFHDEGHAPGAGRGMSAAVVIAVALALLWPVVRKPVILHLLHMDPDDLQAQRSLLACNGQTGKLRLLHWAGIDSDGGDADMALACAARSGHLDTVKLLVGAGDSATAPVIYWRFRDAPRQSAITQALQVEAGLPAVEYLLAHAPGAKLPATGQGTLDAVQAAAMSDCLPCVEWAIRHHAAPDGTWQATPMALWLDNAGRGSHEQANLQRLQVLGVSATAVGEDGRTALHAAANNGDLDAVDWLLAQGADPTLVDGDGNTAVLYAALRLGTGPDNRHIDPAAPSERERVRVVQRLMAVDAVAGARHRAADPPPAAVREITLCRRPDRLRGRGRRLPVAARPGRRVAGGIDPAGMTKAPRGAPRLDRRRAVDQPARAWRRACRSLLACRYGRANIDCHRSPMHDWNSGTSSARSWPVAGSSRRSATRLAMYTWKPISDSTKRS